MLKPENAAESQDNRSADQRYIRFFIRFYIRSFIRSFMVQRHFLWMLQRQLFALFYIILAIFVRMLLKTSAYCDT